MLACSLDAVDSIQFRQSIHSTKPEERQPSLSCAPLLRVHPSSNLSLVRIQSGVKRRIACLGQEGRLEPPSVRQHNFNLQVKSLLWILQTTARQSMAQNAVDHYQQMRKILVLKE